MEETKVCSMCKEEKPIEAFYLKNKSGTKRVSACKTCMRAKSKEQYANDQSYRAKRANNEKARKSWGSIKANYLDIKPHEY